MKPSEPMHSNRGRPHTIPHLKKLSALLYPTCPLPTLFFGSRLLIFHSQYECEAFPKPSAFPARMQGFYFCDPTPFGLCSVMAFITLCHGLSLIHLCFPY